MKETRNNSKKSCLLREAEDRTLIHWREEKGGEKEHEIKFRLKILPRTIYKRKRVQANREFLQLGSSKFSKYLPTNLNNKKISNIQVKFKQIHTFGTRFMSSVPGESMVPGFYGRSSLALGIFESVSAWGIVSLLN